MTSSTTGSAPSTKPPERLIKSVNFTDQGLFDYAQERAESMYGGNFSAYVATLIQRERSEGESRRKIVDLEAQVSAIIAEFGGVEPSRRDAGDFHVPNAKLVIEVKSRFPRGRGQEYSTILQLNKIASFYQDHKLALVFPSDLTPQEEARFRQLETAGIEGFRVCRVDELEAYIKALCSTDVEEVEKALKSQRRRLLDLSTKGNCEAPSEGASVRSDASRSKEAV